VQAYRAVDGFSGQESERPVREAGSVSDNEFSHGLAVCPSPAHVVTLALALSAAAGIGFTTNRSLAVEGSARTREVLEAGHGRRAMADPLRSGCPYLLRTPAGLPGAAERGRTLR
jgi:hypothetical protein